MRTVQVSKRIRTRHLTMELVGSPIAEAVIWVTLAIILGVIGYYFVQRFRDEPDLENSASEHLANFREMKQRGVLEEGEFRNIKTTLGEQMASELVDKEKSQSDLPHST